MHRDANQSPSFEETKGDSVTNPFRLLHKKDKDSHQVGSNLDVKRVKYSYKHTSPGDGQFSPEEEKKEPGRGMA